MALLCILRVAVWHIGAGQWYGVQTAYDGDHFGSGSWWRLHKRAQGFGPQVGDGIVYGLVHHAPLHYVAFLFVHET